jgi:hypothetical protein
LSQAPVHSLPLGLDHDNNPATPLQLFDDYLTLLQGTTSPTTNRTDIRFGEGAFGEMYVTSKVNGMVYLVTNSVSVPGDFNADGAVTGRDYLLWQREYGDTGGHSPADANRDDLVDELDLAVWAEHYGQKYGATLLATSSIPEPTSSSLLLFACFGAFIRRRTR